METTAAASPEKKRDEQDDSSSRQDYRVANDRFPSTAYRSGPQDVTASAAAAKQNPPAAAASSVPYHGAPSMQSILSRSTSASCLHNSRSQTAQASEVYHHPDMPFLVTHWLSHYALPEKIKTAEEKAPGKTVAVRSDQKDYNQEALKEIRQAASNLASAFHKLGAFGRSSRVNNPSLSHETTFADLSRTYSPLLSTALSSSQKGGGNIDTFNRTGNQRVALLDTVVSASSSAHVATAKNDLKRLMPWSLLEAACEGSVPLEMFPSGKVPQTPKTDFGRRLGNSPSANPETAMDSLVPSGAIYGSLMQKPVLDGVNSCNADANDVGIMSIHAAQASRRRLSLRIESSRQRGQMECTMQTLRLATKQAKTGQTMSSLVARRSKDLLEQVAAGSDLDLHRIVAQLERRMDELKMNHSCTKANVVEAQKEAEKSYRDFESIRIQHQESYPLNGEQTSIHQILRAKCGQRNLGFGPHSNTPGKNNIALAAILTRQYQGRHRSSAHSQTISSVLKSRLSHAVTISCHLIYPVYCLKFDRTGRYFITGADDQVVKIFHLGAGLREVDFVHGYDADCVTVRPTPAFNYGANMRGAVLVCSLRGHAGVVADIDVNADNSLLATASGDGDVRVWGLKDGCPVAILRGHKNGANMVSWSKLNPFRLATCGEDGLARMWDVSKAALKQCCHFTDQRFHVSSLEQEIDTGHHGVGMEMEQENHAQGFLPNLSDPSSQGGHQEDDSSTINDPAGIGFGGNPNVGDFVANSRIDEGVILVAQLQHGALVEENLPLGRVTRTGSKAVKVMCIARCPMGGHFATGSDDGLGRVWADDDGWQTTKLDNEINNQRRKSRKPSSAPSQERLLATLRGHSHAVTDMKYSRAGDRILTASMEDGVACVWSWGKEAATSGGTSANRTTSGLSPIPAKFSNISQLLIQLNHVGWGGSGTAYTQQKVTLANCDGVTWTCDDMKIVTSQSSPAKSGNGDIILGSQMIYVWDSHSGKCLMGIMSSHSSLCSTMAPHPFLPSVVASAGSDGVVNVWDLDRGDCFCTHANTLMHGPAEPATDRGKRCGYLDVQFSPDGLYLVLTDENGRVTILDTLVPARLQTRPDTALTEWYSTKCWSSSTPAWMEEQYFANDYYDLVYDTNGHCMERGSELPPHIAPKGVRCTHEGISHSEIVREAYRKLEGPLQLPENSVRWHRDYIRTQRTQFFLEAGAISGNAHRKGKKIVRNTELYQGRKSTAIITKGGQLVQPERKDLSSTESSPRFPMITANRHLNNSASTGGQLSSRYRWVGFNDVPETEDENEEQNDEDYEGNGRNHQESSSEDDNQMRQSTRERGRLGPNRRRQRSTSARESREQRQPARASSRQTAQHAYQELNSDDEHLNEMMSTHTKPSGNFADDWLVSEHLFKMPRGEGSTVHRKWLSRSNYQKEYPGRKFYCPQVGDLVVYIPRAHYDTMQKYPVRNNSMPWKSWPTHSSWPVVCCKVKHIRYRFPYKTHRAARCQAEKVQGVSAILTLEISGVPSQSSTRNFPWPDPNFISLSNESIKFEVTVFECFEEDFIIPEYLYSWRIKELERAAVANNGNPDGISVTVYCPLDNCLGTEDCDRLGCSGHLRHTNERIEAELHFVDSGFNALSVNWGTDEESEDINSLSVFSTWSVSVNTPSHVIPAVPTMEKDVKEAVNSAIYAVIDMDPHVDEWFALPVDTGQYTDYLDMVEVPMCLSLIQKRLRRDYYTNRLSVVADMELVKENCYKYNEGDNEFYELACRMYEKFRCLVLSNEESQAASPEEQSQIHGRKSASMVASNHPETVRENPRVGSASDVLSILENFSDSSDRKTIAHNHVGIAKPPAQTGSGDDLDTVTSDEEDGLREENSKTKIPSRSKPNSTVEVAGKGTQRLTRRSTRGPCRTTRSRKTRNPSHAEKFSEEEGNLDSTCEEENDQSNHDDKVSADISRERKEKTGDDEDGDSPKHKLSHTKDKMRSKRNTAARIKENVTQRQTRQSAQKLQASELGASNRRMNLRTRSKTSYVEKNSEDEEVLESSCNDETDDGDDEASTGEDTASATETSDDEDRLPKEVPKANVQRHRKSSSNKKFAKIVARRSTRKSALKPAQQLQAPKGRSPSRRTKRARPKPSYVEKDSDDEEFAESSDESESDDVVSTEEEPSPKKRRGRHSEGDSPRKKPRRARCQEKDSLNYPHLMKWPHIRKQQIPDVGVAILNKLSELDHLNLFATSVCEEFPGMAEEYLRKVKNPMDFHTIEHERLSAYCHIADLQEDLFLTFRNCCAFHGEKTEYHSHALKVWQSLNDVFNEVCAEKNIRRTIKPKYW